MKIIAVVDLGSNSFKVSVVDVLQQKELGRQTESIRIFPENGSHTIMPPDVIKAATEAVNRLVTFARDKGAEKIVILGTSALRECTNVTAFSDELRKSTGIALLTISGEVEARLASEGVRTDPDYTSYNSILGFDLGGGSLEIFELRGKHCTLAKSLPLGSVRLTHGLLQGARGIIGQGQQEYFQSEILESLQKVIPTNAAENSIIIGGGGAFAAIAMHLEAVGEKPVGGRLPVLRIRELKDKMCQQSSEQRRSVPGIPADRADIMPAALLTICLLADLTKAESFYISYRGVRHGMMQVLSRDQGGLI